MWFGRAMMSCLSRWLPGVCLDHQQAGDPEMMELATPDRKQWDLKAY